MELSKNGYTMKRFSSDLAESSNGTTVPLVQQLEKKNTEIQLLGRTVQELKWESENKDKMIADQETAISILQSRLRANHLDDDVQLQDEEMSITDSPFRDTKELNHKVAHLEKLLSLTRNSESVENLLKENECYKKQITELQIQLHSDIPKTSTSQVEFANLQKDIHDFSIHCQNMYHRLMGYETKNMKTVTHTSERNVNQLAEENQKLRTKVSEITEMNKRWQSYNNQREAYIKKLMASMNASHKENEAKKNAVANGYQEESSKSDKKYQEEILALKAQVKIYAEDFESERQDREKAQARINDLESEILQAKQIHREPSFDEKLYLNHCAASKQDHHHDLKRCVSRGVSDKWNADLQVDGMYPNPRISPSAARRPNSSVSPPMKQNLICPSCMMEFDSDKQTDLLAHVDICF